MSEIQSLGPKRSSCVPHAAACRTPPLWRNPDVDRVTEGLALLGQVAENRAPLRGLRLEALAVCRAVRTERRAATDSAVRTKPRRKKSSDETLATDLLAIAILTEAAAGDPDARMVINHMRRQRGLAALAWSQFARSLSSGSIRAGDGNVPELAAPQL
jgi:hypothetical protein